MRKVFAVLFAFVVLFLGTNTLFAADSDYKNNLLKIEINKIDEDHYDIGLYTQKIYNEPVKVIKKSDTIYYLLLPETSHSITSVPPLDAIKNVMVKLYPYAGQDLNNGYTKVAIITSKPLDITTSLRTLDTSISPRLDPLRLARLDKVFERYSERLAQNNIPTPLAEFRKTAASQRPALQSSVNVKENQNIIASKPEGLNSANSFEEYQNKSNQMQAATKKQAQSAPVVKAQNQAQQKPAVQKQPVSQPVKAKPVVSAPQKQPVAAKQPAPVQKQTNVIAYDKKPAVAPSAPVIQHNTKPAVKTVSSPVQKTETKQQAPSNNAVQDATKIASAPKETVKLSENTQSVDEAKIKEYEKQLPTANPVDVEFSKKVPVDIEANKDITAEIIEPIEKLPPIASQNVPAPNQQVPNQQNQNSNLFLLMGAFAVLLALYIVSKKNTEKKKKAAEVLAARAANTVSAPDIKEILKNRQSKKQEASSDIENLPETAQPVSNAVEQTAQEQAVPVSYANGVETLNTEEEKVQAFNAYMDSITETEPDYSEVYSDEPNGDIVAKTEDDEVIEQLYTPIEANSEYRPYYAEQNATALYEDGAATDAIEDDDSATIVSSSKLTETRGLYLAKFEGSTSLVGYIQDDIYVLYNFGDMELKETDIESRLAQENDTDSLYIVKTGGKKLMVKSTPYDLSLEMVM